MAKWLAKMRIAHRIRGRSGGLSANFVKVRLYEAGQARRRTAQQQIVQTAGGFEARIVISLILMVSEHCVNTDWRLVGFGQRHLVADV